MTAEYARIAETLGPPSRQPTEQEVLDTIRLIMANSAPPDRVWFNPVDLALNLGLPHIARRLCYPGGRKHRSAWRRLLREANERMPGFRARRV